MPSLSAHISKAQLLELCTHSQPQPVIVLRPGKYLCPLNKKGNISALLTDYKFDSSGADQKTWDAAQLENLTYSIEGTREASLSVWVSGRTWGSSRGNGGGIREAADGWTAAGNLFQNDRCKKFLKTFNNTVIAVNRYQAPCKCQQLLTELICQVIFLFGTIAHGLLWTPRMNWPCSLLFQGMPSAHLHCLQEKQ